MALDCHRCSATLVSPENFCPNCGAPQFFYDAEADAAENPGETVAAAAREIQWKSAIGAAVTFAVPVGVLCSSVVPLLSAGCCLWVVGGAVSAVWLYQRRSASPMLPRRVGVRIGTLIGLMAAAVAAAFNAGALVMQRYVFHGGDAMEKAYLAMMEQVATASAQFSASSPAESKQVMQFLTSPDGQAASALTSALMAAAGITLFSMIGGALGTRIFAQRNPSPRNS